MSLIFIKRCELIVCSNYLELGFYFDIRITEKGAVYFENKLDTISYNMKEYTIEEAYVHFCKNRLRKFVDIYKGEKL